MLYSITSEQPTSRRSYPPNCRPSVIVLRGVDVVLLHYAWEEAGRVLSRPRSSRRSSHNTIIISFHFFPLSVVSLYIMNSNVDMKAGPARGVGGVLLKK